MKRFLFIACLFCFLYGCNTGSGDPKEALNNFLTAMKNSDFEEAKKYVTDDSKTLLNALAKDGGKLQNIFKDKQFVINDVHINGTDAQVNTTFTGENSVSINFNLKKEYNSWKVHYNLNGIMIDITKEIMKDEGGTDIDKDINEAIDSIKINEDSLP